MTDIFDEIDPKDGLHVVLVDQTLYCQVYVRGELAATIGDADPVHELYRWPDATAESRGAATRTYALADAITRFLRTGGVWDELMTLVGRLRSWWVRCGGGPAITYPGYYLLDTFPTDDGGYQHIFVKQGTDEAIVWEEPDINAAGGLFGGFIDRTDLFSIREQQQDLDAEEADDADGRDADAAGPAGRGVLFLPLDRAADTSHDDAGDA